jgi:hypothetical protein
MAAAGAGPAAAGWGPAFGLVLPAVTRHGDGFRAPVFIARADDVVELYPPIDHHLAMFQRRRLGLRLENIMRVVQEEIYSVCPPIYDMLAAHGLPEDMFIKGHGPRSMIGPRSVLRFEDGWKVVVSSITFEESADASETTGDYTCDLDIIDPAGNVVQSHVGYDLEDVTYVFKILTRPSGHHAMYVPPKVAF